MYVSVDRTRKDFSDLAGHTDPTCVNVCLISRLYTSHPHKLVLDHAGPIDNFWRDDPDHADPSDDARSTCVKEVSSTDPTRETFVKDPHLTDPTRTNIC